MACVLVGQRSKIGVGKRSKAGEEIASLGHAIYYVACREHDRTCPQLGQVRRDARRATG